MTHQDHKQALDRAYVLSDQFIELLETGPAGVTLHRQDLIDRWSQELPDKGIPAVQVIDELYEAALPGLMLNQSGRFFSWVIGGSHPAALAADWLTSTWDQNAGMFSVAPSAAIAEEIAGKWLKELLHLPSHASFAFVTGCQMAHFTCLAAARNHLFRKAGWDIEAKGFYGAPPVRLLCSDQKHVTIDRALRMLGFGSDNIISIATDEMGRMSVGDLTIELNKETHVPAIVFLQAGDVNTGIYDDFKKIIPLAHAANAWVHIDGAFGLWASASPKYQHLNKGIENADSWATDGHKWLNVPYDCGYAFTAHPESHRRSMGQQASYLTHDSHARDEMDWNPEFSRRARGFATYAVIRELGSSGIADLIDRTCEYASSIVAQVGEMDHAEVVAKPVINQGLLRFMSPAPSSEKDHDDFTEKVIKAINETGEAFFQPTTFKGKRCMRVSVSGWRTNVRDVSRTVAAIKNSLEKSIEDSKSKIVNRKS
jgi:glutamate/tyrosine decarboxylase-like PLP-dependent enzyme